LGAACAESAIPQLRKAPAIHDKDPLEVADDEEIDPSEPRAAPRGDVLLQFTRASLDRLEELLSRPDRALLQGSGSSRQWRWERRRDEASSVPKDEQKTDCIVAIVPRGSSQDFSFLLRVGNPDGWKIVDFLEFGHSLEVPAASSS